jgi:predicted PurR-regulated permease PerM
VPFLDTNHQRAAVLILLLGAGLAIALAPYATGLMGIPVLYVIFAPLHRWLSRRARPRLSAAVVVALGLFLILVPGVSFAGLVINEAQQIASGVIRSPILARLSELHVGQFEVGPQLAALGQRVVSWIGSSLFGLVGTATRLALNLTIAFFGLFYLLLTPGKTWESVRPYIPFSAPNADKLRKRFEDVTISTLIGTGVTAFIQGSLVATGFAITGLPNAVFWGVVTMVFAILPVVGSGLVWVPGVIALIVDSRIGSAVFLGLWGAALVGNIDNVIRPIVFRRWASIHPLVTLVGAFAGVKYFGILGLLIGPLAVSYFFELIRMYGEEYLGG